MTKEQFKKWAKFIGYTHYCPVCHALCKSNNNENYCWCNGYGNRMKTTLNEGKNNA